MAHFEGHRTEHIGWLRAAVLGANDGLIGGNTYGKPVGQIALDQKSCDDRLRVIVNAMTRMRLCTAEGNMEFTHKLAPANMPAGYMPWYDVPGRASADMPVLFGHWASLGVLLRPDVIGLDSGCVWGRKLTAMRLEDRRVFECACEQADSD